jgi:hypothetical protein
VRREARQHNHSSLIVITDGPQRRQNWYSPWRELQDDLASLSDRATHLITEQGGHHVHRNNQDWWPTVSLGVTVGHQWRMRHTRPSLLNLALFCAVLICAALVCILLTVWVIGVSHFSSSGHLRCTNVLGQGSERARSPFC